MRVFIDTSAFYAVLDADDQYHHQARQTWLTLLEDDTRLYTSNYVLMETYALLQNRIGLEAVRILHNDVLPAVNMIWVDERLHQTACSAFLIAGRRRLSLVDCVSFEVMRQVGIEAAFTLDTHFAEQDFDILPSVSPGP